MPAGVCGFISFHIRRTAGYFTFPAREIFHRAIGAILLTSKSFFNEDAPSERIRHAADFIRAQPVFIPPRGVCPRRSKRLQYPPIRRDLQRRARCPHVGRANIFFRLVRAAKRTLPPVKTRLFRLPYCAI